MKYYYSEEWTRKAREIAVAIGFSHVKADRIAVIVGQGSKTRRIVARVHALPKAMQLGMNQRYSFYTIELIEKHFSKESPDEKIRTIIHELMHIPKSFGGGFRGHKGHITKDSVERLYRQYVAYKRHGENAKPL